MLTRTDSNCLILLNDLQQVTHIPVCLFQNGQLLMPEEMEDSPFIHDNTLFSQLTCSNAVCALIPDTVIPQIYYGILRDGARCWICGPCSMLPLSDAMRHEYIANHHMTDFHDFQIVYVTIQRMKAVLRLLHHYMEIPENDPVSFISEPENEDLKYNNQFARIDSMARAEEGFQHHSYRYEKSMHAYIKAGDPAATEKAFKSVALVENAGKMSHDVKKQLEYAAAISVSLFARTAMDAGVDPYRAYDMNDLYLQRISEVRDAKRYEKIIVSAAVHFTEEVQAVMQSSRTTPHIERVKQFIRMNLNKDISMKDISDNIGFSPNYLSALFHQQEGITIRDFILSERIEASKSLLIYTTDSMAEIAAYLHFSSHSHFSSAFRKQTGLTPTQYRNQHQLIDV